MSEPAIPVYDDPSKSPLARIIDLLDVLTKPLALICVCQLDLAPFDALIWPHLAFVSPAGADASF